MTTSRRRGLFGKSKFLFLTVICGILIGCGGTNLAETGQTYDVGSASEAEVREIFEAAVLQKCSESTPGISAGLASALRTVEVSSATKGANDWVFRSDGKSATVAISGDVTGDLLRSLTSDC